MSVKKWKCTVCGQVFEGEAPPAPCPICGAGADAFVSVEEEETEFHRDTLEKFVIIGGGAAGFECASAIRARNALCDITLICGENVIPYNRPALSDVVGDGYSFEAIALKPYAWYAEKNIRLVLDARAEAVDARAKKVKLSDGRELAYDAICLATGANAFQPIKPVEGAIRCYALRTLRDALQIVDECPGKRAIVVGGGILGLEAAVALRERGCAVTVLELGERILSLQADAEASAKLREALSRAGIEAKTGVSVAAPDADGATLTDGARLDADFALVSVGVRSEVTLAHEIGLEIGRGIKVDENMLTSAPDIYAAGDCAEYRGRVMGLWPVAAAQGRLAGARMAGDASGGYSQPIPATAFEALGAKLFTAGNLNPEGADELVYRRADGCVYRRLLFAERRLTGVVFWGDVSGAAEALALMERGASPGEAAGLLAPR